MAEPLCRLYMLMRGGRFERRDGGGVPGGGVAFCMLFTGEQKHFTYRSNHGLLLLSRWLQAPQLIAVTALADHSFLNNIYIYIPDSCMSISSIFSFLILYANAYFRDINRSAAATADRFRPSRCCR